MNISTSKLAFKDLSDQLKVLGHPVRLQILHEIGKGEACVCHLEAQLHIRQATLSQHLMALREADLLTTRRDGRFIYYQLTDHKLLDLIEQIAGFSGVELPASANHSEECDCPKCCES